MEVDCAWGAASQLATVCAGSTAATAAVASSGESSPEGLATRADMVVGAATASAGVAPATSKRKAWSFLTLNSSSGSTGEEMMADERIRSVDVIFWQEHKYRGRHCQLAAARLKRGGRTCFFADAQLTDKGGISGGTALATLSHIGHSAPLDLKTSVMAGGRVLLRHVHGCLPGGLLCACLYLPVCRGSQGRDEHAKILHQLGRYLAAFNRPFLVGGDWNCSPIEVAESGIPHRLQATVVDGGSATCFTPAGGGRVQSTLDFSL